MMDRRTFNSGVAVGFVAVPLAIQAEQAANAFRIGVLSLATVDNTTLATLMIEGLKRRGYVVGRSIEVEERVADGKVDRLPALAAELVDLKVDLIFAGHTSAIRAARDITKTIPIVMAFSGDDPVENGFVASLTHPGGNITGVTTIVRDLVPKMIELLGDAVPRLITRVAILMNPSRPEHVEYVRVAQAVRPRGMQLQVVEAGRPDQYDSAFAAMTQQHAEGLVILPDVVFTKDSGRLAELALLHRLPSIYVYKPFVIAGGLMAYGPDLYQALDLATQYVDKIIKGENPSELPVQQPTRFKLAINLKTSKSLGLTLPRELLLRADVNDVIRQ